VREKSVRKGRNLLFNVVVSKFLEHMTVGRQVESGGKNERKHCFTCSYCTVISTRVHYISIYH
jgi:hypothetical protein